MVSYKCWCYVTDCGLGQLLSNSGVNQWVYMSDNGLILLVPGGVPVPSILLLLLTKKKGSHAIAGVQAAGV